jgi:hypothetical protein
MDRSMRRIGIGLVIAAVATTATVLLAGGVSATPANMYTSVVLSTGQTIYKTGIAVPEGTDVVTSQNTFLPGGSSGWHSHPGATVVTVASGAVTLYVERVTGGRCWSRTFTAGQTFYEWPRNMQDAVASVDTVVIATFFNVPHGGSARIDRDDPGNCPTG